MAGRLVRDRSVPRAVPPRGDRDLKPCNTGCNSGSIFWSLGMPAFNWSIRAARRSRAAAVRLAWGCFRLVTHQIEHTGDVRPRPGRPRPSPCTPARSKRRNVRRDSLRSSRFSGRPVIAPLRSNSAAVHRRRRLDCFARARNDEMGSNHAPTRHTMTKKKRIVAARRHSSSLWSRCASFLGSCVWQ